MNKAADKDIKRVRILKLWEMLSRDTDSEHPLGTEEIIRRFLDMGIECVRATVYSDIKTLQKYGYEVMCNNGVGKSNEYYVGERIFSVPEVQILMNAVQAANFVTEHKTVELVNKVAQLAGGGQADVIKQNIVEFSTVKSTNEKIYYSINEISTAINNDKKISFCYFDYNVNHECVYRPDKENPSKKRVYVVNPLATVYKNDNYYLFCYSDNHDNIAQYRVDRMTDVDVLDEQRTQSAVADSFDLAKHKKQMFDMYGGEEATVTFQARNDNKILNIIFDRFGKEINMRVINADTVEFTADVQISPTFWAWCCSLGNNLKVVAPNNIVDRVKEYLQMTLSQYDK